MAATRLLLTAVLVLVINMMCISAMRKDQHALERAGSMDVPVGVQPDVAEKFLTALAQENGICEGLHGMVAEFYERLEKSNPFLALTVTNAFKTIDEFIKNASSHYDALAELEEQLPNMQLPPMVNLSLVHNFVTALKKDEGVCEPVGLAVEKLYEDENLPEDAEEVLDAWENEVNAASDPALKIAEIAAKWGISHFAPPATSMLQGRYVSTRRRRGVSRRRRGTYDQTLKTLFGGFGGGFR